MGLELQFFEFGPQSQRYVISYAILSRSGVVCIEAIGRYLFFDSLMDVLLRTPALRDGHVRLSTRRAGSLHCCHRMLTKTWKPENRNLV